MSAEESLADFHARLDGATISTYVLVMCFVPLKLWCRIRSGGGRNLGMDDVLTVIALLVANAFFYVCVLGMRKSLGMHVTDILQTPTGIADLTSFLKYVFVGQIFYLLGIAVVKFSIIAFYWRLFAVTARIPIFIMAGVVFSWLMALLFLVIFTCDPIAASWDVTLQASAKCIELKSIYLGGSIPNVITDGILIIMPIPYVWRLHAPIAQRIILAGMFTLGIFIAIVSIIRLNIFMNINIATMDDVTYNFREVIIWSIVEVNVGLVCACLPSLKPALSIVGLNRIFSFNHSRPSNMKSPGPSTQPPSYNRSGGPRGQRKKGSTGGLFSTLGGMTKLDDESEEYQLTVTPAVHGKSNANVGIARMSTDNESRGSGSRERGGGFGGIQVQHDWRVSVDQNGSHGTR
ncbi:hypothetical protein K491DRAFT_721173 [Lophiostoma macrostomum CBS 122681]|uniref:Rhodopsin domain-containing protein n=1 Tax=Lophiostoma macrostomum CBS 122681 TaxID=1314788 RepID=A0A6A6SQ62_9PLEO|nr:hypothetical protein K491DRAFT_721173 [Lophiostoma macrostomum CBS 122681]